MDLVMENQLFFKIESFRFPTFVLKKSNTLVFVTEVIIEQNAISKSQKKIVQRKMISFCLKKFFELTKSSAFDKNYSNKVFVSFQSFWINQKCSAVARKNCG
jgi:hypothetical protein